MSKWLKGCEICNAGLVAEVDRQCKGGISVLKACKLLVKEIERKFNVSPYTAESLMERYRYHKGLTKKKVSENLKSDNKNRQQNKQVAQDQVSKTENGEVVPESNELSAEHHTDAHKASAAASKPPKSELEKAKDVIVRAARLLEMIIDGQIKDNGTEIDKLCAQSIKRHGPGIIISYYRLGIDPEKAVNFYKGRSQNGKKAIHFLANLYQIFDTFQGVVISPNKKFQFLGKKSPTFSVGVKNLSRKVNEILFF
jgi:hypothetical protein